jgi:hypothetical protein
MKEGQRGPSIRNYSEPTRDLVIVIAVVLVSCVFVGYSLCGIVLFGAAVF